MQHKYGVFTNEQFEKAKTDIRKEIYFLLLIVDNKTKVDYPHVDVEKAFLNVFNYICGLNSLLGNPSSVVRIVSLLESALIEYQSESFDFKAYRKIVLDAGCEVLNIKEA